MLKLDLEVIMFIQTDQRLLSSFLGVLLEEVLDFVFV
jgi:hypothetical protein